MISPRPGADRIRVRDDHHCFGCGALNPHGLKMTFYRSPDGVSSPFTPEQRHEGYAGVVHGGIITTVLDEVMAWALYAQEIWAVTGELTVRFRRPMHVGVPTEATGRVLRIRGRTVEVAGAIVAWESGDVLADAKATFVRVGEEQADAWRARYIGESGGRE